jgi:hypothetical protein
MTDNTETLRRKRAQDKTVLPGVYLLADHLDAALALAEDLKAETIAIPAFTPGMAMRSITRSTDDVARGVDRIRAFELAMTARLLQARRRAQDLSRTESRLKLPISLFVGGTAQLEDVVAELGDDARRGFETGHAAQSYLRSRNMIPADAAGLPNAARLAVRDDYAVAGAIPLGALMDMIATFLDTLELMFELFGDGDTLKNTKAAAALGSGEQRLPV